MNGTTKPRQVNMDLLRTISMLLIIFLHSIDHSGVLERAQSADVWMYFYVQLTYMLCQVCVNIYVMLSGYFLVTGKFRLHKLAVLWMETVFYSLTLKLLFIINGRESFSMLSIVSCLVPFLTGRYWFMTIYVGLYLLSPFLNTWIRAMDRQQHGVLNLCLFGIMSVWVSLHPAIAGMNSGGGWGLAWFVVLYLAAAWFRLYYTPDGKCFFWIGSYAGLALVVALLQLEARQMGFDLIQRVTSNWFRYDSAPVYIMSICLFLGFMNLQIPGETVSKLIQRFASLTLGVYLIHAHADVSPWSWEVMNLPEKMSGPWFPLIQLGCVFLIFFLCAAADALRKETVGRLENNRWLCRFCADIESRLKSLLDKKCI